MPPPTEATRAVVTATSQRFSEEAASLHHFGDHPREVVTHRVEVDAEGKSKGILKAATTDDP